MNSTSKPYDWLKSIPSALLKEDAIPLFHSPVEFPWEKVTKELAQKFQIPTLKITPGEIRWRSENELVSDFGEGVSALNIVIPSLDGQVTWVMADNDVRLLMSELLNQGKSDLTFIHQNYVSGFYRFIAKEILFSIGKTKFTQDLSPQIGMDQSLTKEPSLSYDFKIETPQQTVLGRLLIPSDMRRSWMQAQTKPSLNLSQAVSEKVQVQLSIEAGRTSLTLKEWKQVSPGDFVVLDSCSLIPGDEKGRVMITLDGIPFFRAKIKQGSIKLLEHPLHYEVENNMGKKFSDEDDEFENGDSEMEDELTDDDSEFEHLDEDSEEFEIEGEEAEEEGADAKEEHEQHSEEHEEPSEEHKEHSLTSTSPSAVKAEEIPLSIIVEVGRFQMSIQKLTQLQPGNLLELNVRPEEGVDLVVNGRRIAKGELLRIGEVLGVRILDIG